MALKARSQHRRPPGWRQGETVQNTCTRRGGVGPFQDREPAVEPYNLLDRQVPFKTNSISRLLIPKRTEDEFQRAAGSFGRRAQRLFGRLRISPRSARNLESSKRRGTECHPASKAQRGNEFLCQLGSALHLFASSGERCITRRRRSTRGTRLRTEVSADKPVCE